MNACNNESSKWTPQLKQIKKKKETNKHSLSSAPRNNWLLVYKIIKNIWYCLQAM